MTSKTPERGEAVRIALLDLDPADVQDIQRGLQGAAAGLVPEEVPGNRYGEPGTLVLAVVLAQPVIHALAAWILKQRRKQTVVVRTKLTLIGGEEFDREVRIDLKESQSEGDVAAQLVSQLGLDPNQFLGSGTGSGGS